MLNNRLGVLIVLQGIVQEPPAISSQSCLGFRLPLQKKTEKIAGLLLRPEEYLVQCAMVKISILEAGSPLLSAEKISALKYFWVFCLLCLTWIR